MVIDWRNTQVRLNVGGRVRCDPGWELPPAWSQRLSDFDLWFVWAGRGLMQLHHQRVALGPGVGFWMRPGGLYLGQQSPTDRLGVSFIHFDLLDDRGQPIALGDDDAVPEVYDVPDVGYVDTVMRRILHLMHLREIGPAAARERSDQAAGVLMKGLLMDLVAWSTRQAEAGGSGPLASDRRAILALASRLSEDPAAAPNVAQLAGEAGYSPDHFTRLFRAVLGQTPKDYIVTARLSRAKQWLIESDRTISQIAAALGYPDAFTFSAQFKKKTGLSPRAYRQRAHLRGEG
ncbi:MAG TPA: helix-turn-helix transcriptional regulator [Phycisphaeraceae bacterium]